MTIEKFNPTTLEKPHGFAHAVTARGGTTVYLSGQLPTDVEGKLIDPDDYTAQAERAMLNLNLALEAAGGSATDLVKTTIYVVGHNPETEALVFKGFGAAARKIGSRPVASVLIGCSSLVLPGALIEVDGIAVIGAE
jgi:enamine deaminase RidA (YjgF/YER057c/UK114 family)